MRDIFSCKSLLTAGLVFLATSALATAQSATGTKHRPPAVTPGSFGHTSGPGGNAASPIAVAPGWFDRGSKSLRDLHPVTPASPRSGLHANANLAPLPPSGRFSRGGSGGSGRGGSRNVSHGRARAGASHRAGARR